MKANHPYNDILQQVQKIADNSVQTIVSHPPFIQRILEFSKGNDFQHTYESHLNSLENLWKECLRILKADGTMWIFCDHYFCSGQLSPIPFSLGKRIQSTGFLLRNIIIWYNKLSEQLSRDLVNRYSCILFFAENRSYKFDMDPIREPHIWRDAEWGGGRRSRYHPKGKDPSNFWLKAESEEGKITRHVILSPEEAISRCILASTDEGDRVLDFFAENAPTIEIVKKLNRIPLSCSSRVNYSEEVSKQISKREFVTTPRHMSKNDDNALYLKTCERMDEVEDSSVQVIVTSPPYWGLRDYGVPDQIGFDEPYSKYLDRLETVGKECHRVLKSCGSLWISINKRFITGDILLFPADIIKKMTNIGFYLKEIVIWHRPIFVPATGPKNFADRHEYLLFFAKDKYKYLLKSDAFRQNDYVRIGNGEITNVWRMFRKIGNIGREVKVMIKEKKIEHTAVYPKELVRRIILLCSDEGDTVLDPFAGSGTTLVVANRLGRRWIGYEINPDYKEIINWRLEREGQSLLPWL